MTSTTPWLDRVIIALDLDAFYVAASRKRDPTLNGLPVGIRQKGILATVSYEARALGVRKLATIRDGMAQCPEMILVNGEDLSYFRKISMQVFKLVSSMIWGGRVEKLGMDELFCDCTEMMDARLVSWEKDYGHEAIFPAPVGFTLPQSTNSEIKERGCRRLDRQARKLILATHLAQEIRIRVAEEIGLTSSAGIASSKLMAKLVGNTHKPNQQTVFASLNSQDVLADARAFLDPFPLRSLNGFGSVIVEKLCKFAAKATDQGEKEFPSSQLTVSLARQIFDGEALRLIFGQRLGSRLLNLLQAKDDEPVIKAPDFPAQISIEDTFRNLQGFAILDQIFILGQSLLRRLETELVDFDEEKGTTALAFHCVEKPVTVDQTIETGFKVRDYEERLENQRYMRTGSWKRYPLSVRLSIRQGWENRVSRQARMPVEVFDLSMPRPARARVLANSLESVLKAIFASEGNRGIGLNLINIAALDLSPHRPAKAIGGFFTSGPITGEVERQDARQEEIDRDVLRELPEELRAEIAREYNIPLSQPSNTEADSEEGRKDGMICEWCGQVQNDWLQHDHLRWPHSGLPPSPAASIQWISDSDDEETSDFVQ